MPLPEREMLKNPLKKSSGSQFYIVQGQVYDSEKLAALEQRRVDGFHKDEFKNCLNDPENADLKIAYSDAMKKRDRELGQQLIDSVNVMITPSLEKYYYTEEQREVYTTIGGTPHLDYAYTVFGEMIEGFDVLDSIAAVQTDRNNRPMEDVVMTVKIVKK